MLPELMRGRVAAASGRYREAVERGEVAMKMAPLNDGRVLYAAVGVWSLASAAAAAAAGPDAAVLAKEYADRAAESGRGPARGSTTSVSGAQSDDQRPSPAPVRSHPKVRDLLADRP